MANRFDSDAPPKRGLGRPGARTTHTARTQSARFGRLALASSGGFFRLQLAARSASHRLQAQRFLRISSLSLSLVRARTRLDSGARSLARLQLPARSRQLELRKLGRLAKRGHASVGVADWSASLAGNQPAGC